MQLLNDSVTWFAGVVEDREDPMKLGRVRVRVYGQHPYSKVQGDIKGIATQELLWMPVAQDITSAAISGVGQSPTGMVTGTHVFGLYLDRFKSNPIILGTYAGTYAEKPDINEGFSDPTGEYPRYIGNDVNVLATGDAEVVKESVSYVTREYNAGVAVNPDEGPVADIPEDDNPENFTLQKMLIRDEGYKLKVYWDSEGYPTVGVGHLIQVKPAKTKDMNIINKKLSDEVGRQVNGVLTQPEVDQLFKKDTERQLGEMGKYTNIMAAYNAAGDNTPRKWALINMSFNLGAAGLSKFTKSLGLMAAGQWAEAAKNMKDSLWFRQVKGRGPRICNTVQFGNLEAYGVKAPRPEGKSLSAAIAKALASDDPSEPWTPEDSRIMFKEPASSWAAVYPYNKVMESESGHVIEVDDTPSNERLHWKHTNGTYEEWAPGGDVVKKVTGDKFEFIDGDNNISASSNENHVVNGSMKEYVMGNITVQTDGEHVMIVRGAKVLRVEGNSTVLVDGDSTVEVKGNANIKVEGDCEQTIQGDYTLRVQGNYSVSVKGQRMDNVTGTWTRQTTGAVSDKSSANFSIDGTRIDFG